MEVRLKLVGIGDLTLTALKLFQCESQTISVYPCNATLGTYRPGNTTYSDFVIEYLQRLLPSKTILKSSNHKAPVGDSDIKSFDLVLQDKAIIQQFEKVFKTSEMSEYTDCFVLNTKVRQYPYGVFNKHSPRFWDVLNNSGRKIVLLGERIVEYGIEYETHGKDMIYSLYPEATKHLKGEVVDLTVGSLGIKTPDVDSIFRDMNIISNCYRVINVGGGGFFCTSMLTGKLLAVHSSEVTDLLPGQVGKQLFESWNEFLKRLGPGSHVS